jgi:hypothetical protein
VFEVLFGGNKERLDRMGSWISEMFIRRNWLRAQQESGGTTRRVRVGLIGGHYNSKFYEA